MSTRVHPLDASNGSPDRGPRVPTADRSGPSLLRDRDPAGRPSRLSGDPRTFRRAKERSVEQRAVPRATERYDGPRTVTTGHGTYYGPQNATTGHGTYYGPRNATTGHRTLLRATEHYCGRRTLLRATERYDGLSRLATAARSCRRPVFLRPKRQGSRMAAPLSRLLIFRVTCDPTQPQNLRSRSLFCFSPSDCPQEPPGSLPRPTWRKLRLVPVLRLAHEHA